MNENDKENSKEEVLNPFNDNLERDNFPDLDDQFFEIWTEEPKKKQMINLNLSVGTKYGESNFRYEEIDKSQIIKQENSISKFLSNNEKKIQEKDKKFFQEYTEETTVNSIANSTVNSNSKIQTFVSKNIQFDPSNSKLNPSSFEKDEERIKVLYDLENDVIKMSPNGKKCTRSAQTDLNQNFNQNSSLLSDSSKSSSILTEKLTENSNVNNVESDSDSEPENNNNNNTKSNQNQFESENGKKDENEPEIETESEIVTDLITPQKFSQNSVKISLTKSSKKTPKNGAIEMEGSNSQKKKNGEIFKSPLFLSPIALNCPYVSPQRLNQSKSMQKKTKLKNQIEFENELNKNKNFIENENSNSIKKETKNKNIFESPKIEPKNIQKKNFEENEENFSVKNYESTKSNPFQSPSQQRLLASSSKKTPIKKIFLEEQNILPGKIQNNIKEVKEDEENEEKGEKGEENVQNESESKDIFLEDSNLEEMEEENDLAEAPLKVVKGRLNLSDEERESVGKKLRFGENFNEMEHTNWNNNHNNNFHFKTPMTSKSMVTFHTECPHCKTKFLVVNNFPNSTNSKIRNTKFRNSTNRTYFPDKFNHSNSNTLAMNNSNLISNATPLSKDNFSFWKQRYKSSSLLFERKKNLFEIQ